MTSSHGEKERFGHRLRRRTKEWKWDGNRGLQRDGRKTIQVDVWAKDGGGGRPTESRELTMEEGARKTTGRSWNRRSQVGQQVEEEPEAATERRKARVKLGMCRAKLEASVTEV